MITIIGSINMDLVCQSGLFPQQGETVLGERFETIPGGKGANQAVAAARLGSQVAMIGAVGNDSFGDMLIDNLEKEKIDTNGVSKVSESTGIANIIVHNQDNRIIVVPGANFKVDKTLIDKHRRTIERSKLVIMQLEIPVETVEYTLDLCSELKVPVIVNPAPAQNFRVEWMDKITFLTPNETECNVILGLSAEQAVREYPNKLIVTLGDKGAMYSDGNEIIHVEGYRTTPVDTTGAGDTFNGAFAHAYVNGKSLNDATHFANIAASLSVEGFGAQGGMPGIDAVEARLRGKLDEEKGNH
ncbi:ribokinase [Pradoshia sp. D12]|uniref:ribokinase n=1 Tax=Bacillaceae TaxID=186817 RepID=UPI00080AE02A|nr:MULTISPECIES: ribokinase [Bacillaceae]OCA89253.1 ribokinase [Bacillus sp. FJAT-27986]QFK69945.1 ribokinase [Pradoshia sp. D12]TPF70557.1 ribokinase [Bacillus sp. D12]